MKTMDRLVTLQLRRHVATALPIVAVIILAVLVSHERPAAAKVESRPAYTADAFVDSIGVNVHLHYTDTVYSRFDNVVAPRLLELGVRHIRDGAYTYKGASANTFYYRRLRELGQQGIHANLITTIDTRFAPRTDIAKLDDVQTWSGGAVQSFEGVNEPDLNGGKDWAEQTRELQRDVWTKVQRDPALRGVEVVGPSPAWRPGALGDISAWTDYGNWHAYPGGKCPTCRDVYGKSFDTRVGPYRAPTGNKPLVVSETGYHNAVLGKQDHPPVSERAASRYVPRLLFEYFNRGVARSYIYELLDLRHDPTGRRRDEHFGLLRNDGSRKPAFIALRNLIDLLQDPGPAFSPSSLQFRLTGDTDQVHHTLLQKRDGRFYLALWQERPSYDTGQRANQPDHVDARRDIDVASQPVTVATDDVMLGAKLYVPGQSVTAERSWIATNAMTFDVSDEVMLLELTPLPDVAPPSLTPPDGSDPCADVPSVAFTDVPAGHTFAAEIDCLHAWNVAHGVGAGRHYEPQQPLLRWQMAVFIARLAALDDESLPREHGSSTFADVRSLSMEAQQAVASMQKLGVVTGTTRTSFGPFERVTRAQIAAFLNRLLQVNGDAAIGDRDYFTDDDASTHEADINAIAAARIVRGVGHGRFRPEAAVTRGEMAAMLTRYIQRRVGSGDVDAGRRS
jgi:hypothetical protein